jgi:anti-sigma factor RsiW
MADHLTDVALDAYLDDALDEPGRSALEAHTRICEPCAARLARAARAELALLDLAAEPPPRRRALRWPIVAAAASFAAAAAVLIIVQSAGEAELDRREVEREVARVEHVVEPLDPEGAAFTIIDDAVELPSSAELTMFVPEAEP